ncbi:hypothetical protein D9980_05340 [Serratia sp. 3ACOL1]|uniref:putative phage abortive infection protein n=1 Tax=Serratia sp. 3ACOL1 TaxID=2448483 RepID=UPI000EF5230A|nr:putative phage abortive infection protein [Serratia sp. 3ACOL1]AYM90050.1 hypothetical protein D9980_05340 [Serratia sp. 3ACOL1]
MNIIISAIVLFVCFFYFIASFYLEGPFYGVGREELGQFGDSWGFLTSIFSAMAFIGVLLNNRMQVSSFKEARKTYSEQARFMRVQQFESSLFQMLSLLQDIISDMDIFGKKDRKGRDCFKFIYLVDLKKGFTSFAMKERESNILNEKFSSVYKTNLGHFYGKIYKKRQQDLGHYFRFLFNIFRFISESELNSGEKKKYANIVRAQLSNYELLMLFYNCIYAEGQAFERYAIEFMIFDNMPISELLDIRHALLIDSRALPQPKVVKSEEPTTN